MIHLALTPDSAYLNFPDTIISEIFGKEILIVDLPVKKNALVKTKKLLVSLEYNNHPTAIRQKS